MYTKDELNLLSPDNQIQEDFAKVMGSVLFGYPVSDFSTTITYADGERVTLSFSGVITYKLKHGDDLNNQPRYVIFYKPSTTEAEGHFGEITLVHAVYKYPSWNDSLNLATTIPPLKKKYPDNLIIKRPKPNKDNNYKETQYQFFKTEQQLGGHFIRMPYRVGENANHFRLLMEKFPGITLEEFIKRLNTNPNLITTKTYLLIATNLLKALKEIHNKGIIHCDIKPSNILIDKHYDIKIIDYGLAYNATDTREKIHGSQPYLPPNIKKNTFETDIYTMGLVIIELLGQTDRRYLLDIKELAKRNCNVLTHEILLGVKEVSLEEFIAITNTLKAIVKYKPEERLVNLETIITMFQAFFDEHTTSAVSPSTIPDKINIQNIISWLKKGHRILVADIEEWFSTAMLNNVGVAEWSRIALYLYSQIQNEADDYFKNTVIVDAFINDFITKLPTHIYWQDPTHKDYVQNVLNIDTAIKDINSFIFAEGFGTSAYSRKLESMIQSQLTPPPNATVQDVKIAHEAKIFRDIPGLLSASKNCHEALNLYPEIKALGLESKLTNIFNQDESDIGNKLELLKKYKAHINNIKRLEKSNPTCYATIYGILNQALLTPLAGKFYFEDFTKEVQCFLTTMAWMEQSFLSLDNLKNHYNLNNACYSECLMLLNNNMLQNLTPNNPQNLKGRYGYTINTWNNIANIINKLKTIDVTLLKNAPKLTLWRNEILPKRLVNVKNFSEMNRLSSLLTRFENNLNDYLNKKYLNVIEQHAFELLIQNTQFIFNSTSLNKMTIHLDVFNQSLSHLIPNTIKLLSLKNILTQAGYWEDINALCIVGLQKCLTKDLNYPQNLNNALIPAISTGYSVVVLFNAKRCFQCQQQEDIFHAIATAIINNQCPANIDLYKTLQDKIGLKLQEPLLDLSWLPKVVVHCSNLALEKAIDELGIEEMKPTLGTKP